MNPNEKAKLRQSLEALSVEYAKLDLTREAIKDVIDALSEEYDISTRNLRKIALMMHKRNAKEEFAKNNELEELYEELAGPEE